jgi:pSer/pThr/pTyr-binding forkhead associated (FHA) protein
VGVVLEIKSGPMVGKAISLATGQTVTVGRAAGRAQFALPHDTFMSGVHFAVECGTSGCRVQDRKSSNGTFLNGARIQDAMLANGDEIKGGQTIFAVKIVADAKLASLMPAQEVAPPSIPQPIRGAELASPAAQPLRPAASEPASPSASQPRPPAAESAQPPASQLGPPSAESAPPSDPLPRPGAAEQAPPSAPGARAPAAEPAPPLVSVSARSPEEPNPAALKVAPELPLPARARCDSPELPSPEMWAADLDAGADVRPTQDAGVEPAGGKSSGVPSLPAQGLPHKLEAPFKSTLPSVEEPPRLRAIPSPPGGVENSPGAGVKPPRSGEPPAGVAPHIAQKFAERPASRGVGSSRGAAFSVMGWSFPAAPAEWLVQEGFGLQQSGHEEFPSSVAATEELLGGITLQQFVESQISTLRGYLRDPKIEPTMPPRVGGAEESMAVDVRHSTKDGRELVYRRIYARSGSSVGVLTVTTLAADFPQVLQSLQPLLDGAAFRSTTNN